PHHPHLHPFPTRRSSDLAHQGEGRPPKADSSTTSGCREPAREAVAAGRLIIYFLPGCACRMLRSTSASLRGSVSAGFGRSPCFPDRKSTRLNSSHVEISY